MQATEGNALSALLLQISDATDAAIPDAVGLSARELAALVLIRNRAGCTVSWLHGRLGLTQSGAVRLLDRLQDLGLVERVRSDGRREVALAVTARGKRVVTRGTTARAQVIDGQLSGLSRGDRDAFMALAARALAGQCRTQDEGDQACRLCDWRVCTPDCPMEQAVRRTASHHASTTSAA
jgi:DNA-binding MarR family transcriptional regulator